MVQSTLWYRRHLLLVAGGVCILALPDSVEGPTLIKIAEGHAISLLDAFAIIPLFFGSLFLFSGIVRRRHILVSDLNQHPRVGVLVPVGGVGLGMLLASAFSSFFWWWAIGALLLGVAVWCIAVISGKE